MEPVELPREPWQLVAQQAMALVLEAAGGGLALSACKERLGALFPELPAAGIGEVVVLHAGH